MRIVTKETAPISQAKPDSGLGDLRDYFATHAPEPPQWWLNQQRGTPTGDLQQLVRWRFVWADAMLNERKARA